MSDDENNRRFAIALSFPGEHRRFVRNVARRLADELGNTRVFFDEWYEAELRGTGADLKLKRIYREQSALVVPFFSKHYEKTWCHIEWHAIRALLVERRKDDAVVPVHLDNTRIDGWESIDLGIRRRNESGQRFAEQILDVYRHRQSTGMVGPEQCHTSSQESTDGQPSAELRQLSYDDLATELLGYEPGLALPHPERGHNIGGLTDFDEQRLAAIVCRSINGMTADRWAMLETMQRMGWMQEAVAARRAPKLGASNRSEAANLAIRHQGSPDLREHNLRIHVSPTRSGRRQLASINLFNAGPRPIYVSTWYVSWGLDIDRSASQSVDCLQGHLPKRLEDQESLRVLVDVSERPIDELREIGVFDGENRIWLADEAQIQNFIRVAKQHALPPLPAATVAEPPKPSADIKVQVSKPDHRGSKRIEVLITNIGESSFTLARAELHWEYDPPRWGEKIPGRPQVAEAGGAMTLHAQHKRGPLQPNGQSVFFVDAYDCPVLVGLLADDVVDAKIAIRIIVEGGFAWTVSGEEVPIVVREVAQNALEFEHRRS